ncbi:hypothetical protein N7481_008996 [Penicillium waksmanii]|uniref:uncharacterized protein n=1 Tax=Penicillium waksmanii TaxID=69791 RepID=UPI002548F033|nr:uncharacterized protein N7481_008996 [Penicillium waksmanii]KAJ5975289.1 hypothetical protein N7481_008996 [Penicillium waksmanii]
MSAPSGALTASAVSFVLLSIAHTIGGKEWQSDKVFKNIKGSRAWACGKVGWYQGSAFLFLSGILHYQWSRNPSALADPLNKAMAAIINVLLWSSSAWYAKNGILPNVVACGLAASLQAFGVLKEVL